MLSGNRKSTIQNTSSTLILELKKKVKYFSVLIFITREFFIFQSNSESLEEEFHENLIYDRLYRQHSASSGDSLDCRTDQLNESQRFKKSLSISNDSLDTRDHSDGMWNESVTTVCLYHFIYGYICPYNFPREQSLLNTKYSQVLPIDSDNNGVGTCLSCSDISSPITPHPRSSSSKRKLLLLQHQQRSSMDTEGIDADEGDSKWVRHKTTKPIFILKQIFLKINHCFSRSMQALWKMKTRIKSKLCLKKRKLKVKKTMESYPANL